MKSCRDGPVTVVVRGYALESDLPSAARAYIERLEELSGAPAAIISTGSDRKDTIVREGGLASRWLK